MRMLGCGEEWLLRMWGIWCCKQDIQEMIVHALDNLQLSPLMVHKHTAAGLPRALLTHIREAIHSLQQANAHACTATRGVLVANENLTNRRAAIRSEYCASQVVTPRRQQRHQPRPS
jgi:hypothetical protein